ncbi:MAG: 3-dehydroquinate synthase [Planctomycetes bacterium]|nr:3-dehydroquinate synthase [Planctomycetota bacterium]
MLDRSLKTQHAAACRLRGERGALAHLGTWLAELLPPPRKVALVTDRNVAPFWLKAAETALKKAGYATHSLQVPSGEESKSLKILGNVWDRVLTFGVDRSSVLVALGGGVVGDLCGFAAATLLRGLPLVQVPTSLVGQVDAAIGGKTGINRPLGKNLVGAFHQPHLVVIDPDLLSTLPEREFRSGLAEVMKYGWLCAPDLLAQLREANDLEGLRGRPELVDAIVRRCAELKIDLVEKDEREAGERALLNFGHTTGHALEAADGYRNLLHGEAVAIGMVAASFLAVDLGVAAATLPAEVSELLERYGLPVATPFTPADLLPYLGHDKKRAAGKSRWVLVERAGSACIVEEPAAASVERALVAIHREPTAEELPPEAPAAER